MKLNPDCVRNILLTVEENTSFGIYMEYPDDDSTENFSLLSPYTEDEVLYHINQCEISGLLTKVEWFLGGSCMIMDLSPQGHKFLADIRSDNNWNRAKEIAKKTGSFSLDTLKQIATGVITELIKSQF